MGSAGAAAVKLSIALVVSSLIPNREEHAIMQKITPFLWFDDKAEEAVRLVACDVS